MKAKKQKLEEQIINTCLANPEISNVLRDSMLEALVLTKNLEEVEAQLNNLTKLKQMTEFGDAFRKKFKKVRGQVLQLDNKKHMLQLIDSLVGKGFLEGGSNGDVLTNDYSLDPNCLTDQEFLLFIEISCAVEQHKKRGKNE
jgi:hypothetical protein